MSIRLLTLAIASTGMLAGPAEAEDLARMGPEWFQRLRNPETRRDALYAWEQASADPEQAPDREEWDADNQTILVFRCPQPGRKDAWAVLFGGDWQRGQEILTGLEKWAYPPHPLEKKRLAEWAPVMRQREAKGEPWRADEPWFDGLMGFLLDQKGNQLTEGFFLGCGAVADFNGDGCLDLFEIERFSSRDNEVLDGISIGPLDTDQPRLAHWFCNRRKRSLAKRDWRFELREAEGGTTDLAFLPQADGERLVFSWRKDQFAADREIPNGIHFVRKPDENSWDATAELLARQGFQMRGVGSDRPDDLDARLISRRAASKYQGEKSRFSLPALEGLTPRQAALAIVEHNRDAVHKSQFDLAFAGPEVPLPETGWLEDFDDGGGWGQEESVTWWLKPDRAERWEVHESGAMSGRTVPREQVARAIAVVLELDRIRCVPKHPRISKALHWPGGGDDFPLGRVRAVCTKPRRVAAELEFTSLAFWNRIGGFYNRKTASAMSQVASRAFPKGGEQIAIALDAIALDEQVPRWLDPARIAKVPPAVAKAALLHAAQHDDGLPVLRKLHAHFGRPTPGEMRLAELPAEIRAAAKAKRSRGRERWMAIRKFNALRCEERDLRAKLAGDPRFELRKALEEALTKKEGSP